MDFDTLYLKVLKYLNYRFRSEKEIRDYLKQKLSPSFNSSISSLSSEAINLIDLIIYKLKQQKFLNDHEFAKLWVRSRTSYKPKGEYIIKMELRQKGISEDIIEEVFSDPENRQQSEVNLAAEILEKKKKKYQPMERQERFNKAGSMLARRGFDLDTIKAAMDKVFGK